MASTPHFSINYRRQRGFSLAVGLILLLVMTLIGVTTTRTARTELLLANNAQNSAEAFAAAESSAVAGERDVFVNYSGTPSFDFATNTADGYYSIGQVPDIDTDWSDLPHVIDGAANEFEYVVEYLGPAVGPGNSLGVGNGSGLQKRFVFRITGRGESSRGSTRLVQTVFATNE